MLSVKNLILYLTFVGIVAHAQQRPTIEFGKVSLEELTMTRYERDTSAIAVVLFDYGKFTPTRSTRHFRIKILKKDGLQLASGAAYYGKGEIFANFKAVTYNLEDDKIAETAIDKASIFKEEFTERVSSTRYALTQVKVGSIIEVSYELRPMSPGGIYLGGREWEFQRFIPCVWSEFIFERSTYGTYQRLIQGYLPVAIAEEKGETWRWVMTNIPAFTEEPYSASHKNYISKARVVLASVQPSYRFAVEVNTDWPTVKKTYLESVFSEGNVKSTRFLKDQAETLAASSTTSEAKVTNIYKYVKDKIEWNGRESPVLSYGKKVIDKSTGASGEINLILLAMLRHAGIKADPVLVSTRENGFVRRDLPDIDQFNRVLVQTEVGGKKIVIDATDRMLPMEFLPENCLNGVGLLVDQGATAEWVEIITSTLQRSRTSITADFKVSPNGSLDGKVGISRTGYEGRSARKQHSTKGKDDYALGIFSAHKADMKESSIEGATDLGAPLKENYFVVISDHGTPSGDLVYIDPMLFARIEQDLFKKSEREYPIDFIYPREIVYNSRFALPEGYVVEELPAPKMAILPENGGKFVFNVVENGGVVTVVSQFVINRSLYSQVEYPNLREFYKAAAAKQAEQIVIKKKN